jgi:hypothetical protein
MVKKKKTADIFADPSGETWNQKEKSKKRMCNKKQENPAENEIFLRFYKQNTENNCIFTGCNV